MRRFQSVVRCMMCVILTIALCAGALPQAVQAAAKTGSVTFSYELSGCTFRLYYIGTYTDSDNYELSSDFKNTAVSRADIEEGNWFTFALTLDTVVVYAGISPTAEGTTGSDGTVTFSGLKEGIYLMTADTMTVDNTTYKVTPMIIQMPGYYTDGSYEYDREITISKYDTEVTVDYTSVSVMKVWDDGDSASRPDSVVVYLLQGDDGAVFDEVTLSVENNWTYTWENLDASYTWRVAEQEMTEYGVSYSVAADGTIVITNQQGMGKTHNPGHSGEEESESWEEGSEEVTETLTEEETESGGYPHEGDEESEDIEDTEWGDDMIYEELSEETEYMEDYTEEEETETEEEDMIYTNSDSESGPSSSTNSSSSSKLPQTGLDWGPAAYLVLAAAVCFLIGVIRSRSSRKEEE